MKITEFERNVKKAAKLNAVQYKKRMNVILDAISGALGSESSFKLLGVDVAPHVIGLMIKRGISNRSEVILRGGIHKELESGFDAEFLEILSKYQQGMLLIPDSWEISGIVIFDAISSVKVFKEIIETFDDDFCLVDFNLSEVVYFKGDRIRDSFYFAEIDSLKLDE